MQRPSFGDAKGRNMAETFVKLEHSSEEVLMPHPSLEAPPEASRSNSSSELSELEESDFDAAPVAFGDTAETFVESESSSDDVKEHQRYREIEAKNTWALSDSEESDSMVSNTSEDSSYSSGTESEASDFSHGIKTGEIESDVHDALDEESLDEISGRAYDPKPRAAPNRDQGAPSVRRRLSSQASKSPTQNSSFSNIRLSPHDPELFTIAFKCLKDERRFQVDYEKLADLADFKSPTTASTAWSRVKKRLVSNASSPRLTTREEELTGLAFQSLKDDCIIQIDHEKLAELAGYSSASSGNACWLVIGKKLVALASPVTHASPAAVTALRKRKGSATTTNFNDSESEHIIKLPKRRRGNAELPSKVDLGAKPSNLSKSQMLSGSKGHERPRTVPKAPRSPNTNQSRPQNSSSKINDHTVDKSRQIPGSPGPAVDLRESPILHTWRQPPVSRISINSTDDDSIPHIRDPDLDSLRALDNRSTQEQAATTTNVNEAGANALKVKDSISSAVPKERKKKMVWNSGAEHLLLLAIIEVQGLKMDHEAIGKRIGCSGKAIKHYLGKLQKKIPDRTEPITFARPQNATGTAVPSTEARPQNATGKALVSTEGAVESHNSNAHHNATKDKTALFVKNEIVKLEARLEPDDEYPPWSKEEENALERGMRRFTGPYWSDVLGLFGQNGSVNNVLRNRDEAQLEDKACRNKIWYLKSGIKFPFYLRLVTGDRKKTAPAAIGDGKGEKGAGEDNGQVKSDVAVTSDEGTRCEPHSPPVVAPPPPQHYPSIPLLQYPDPGYRGPTPAYRDSRGVLHLGLPPQFHVPHLVNGVPAEPPSFQYRRDSQGNLYQVPYVPPAMRGPPVPSLQPPMRSPSMREHGHGPAVTEIAPTAPEYAIDVDDVS